MSQVEANEVMELWAQRQREESNRQSLVTIHDVAEATQLTPNEVQRLLQEVRSAKPTPQLTPPLLRTVNDMSNWKALVKVGPMSGLATFIIFYALAAGGPQAPSSVAAFCAIWSFAMAVTYIGRWLFKKGVEAQIRRLAKDSETNYRTSSHF